MPPTSGRRRLLSEKGVAPAASSPSSVEVSRPTFLRQPALQQPAPPTPVLASLASRAYRGAQLRWCETAAACECGRKQQTTLRTGRSVRTRRPCSRPTQPHTQGAPSGRTSSPRSSSFESGWSSTLSTFLSRGLFNRWLQTSTQGCQGFQSLHALRTAGLAEASVVVQCSACPVLAWQRASGTRCTCRWGP